MTPSYVMLKCPDGKKIITSYNNLLSLSEFIDCFNIKVESCKIDDADNAVSLEEIANIFCDSNYVKNSVLTVEESSESLNKDMPKDKSSRYIRNKIKETKIGRAHV